MEKICQKKAVEKMIETAENDATLRNQLQTAAGPEAVLAIATEKGYQFTEEELFSVMQEKQISFYSEEELSEEQLEAIAGGGKKNVKTVHYCGR